MRRWFGRRIYTKIENCADQELQENATSDTSIKKRNWNKKTKQTLNRKTDQKTLVQKHFLIFLILFRIKCFTYKQTIKVYIDNQGTILEKRNKAQKPYSGKGHFKNVEGLEKLQIRSWKIWGGPPSWKCLT